MRAAEAARIALMVTLPAGVQVDQVMDVVEAGLHGTERVTINELVVLRKLGTSLIEASFIPNGENLWIHVFPPKVTAVRKALRSLELRPTRM